MPEHGGNLVFMVQDEGIGGLAIALEDGASLWTEHSSVREFLRQLLIECNRHPFGGPDDPADGKVALDLGRDAYFVVGVDGGSAQSILRVRRAEYLHLLLMSPMVHPAVDAYLDRRWRETFRLLRPSRAFVTALDLGLATLSEFRQGLDQFLDPDEVHATVATLGWPRPLALGVAGCVIVENENGKDRSLLGVRRSKKVAIAVNAIGPPVDGGLRPDAGALTETRVRTALRIEAVDELHGVPELTWDFAGVSLLDDPSRSGGLTFTFVSKLKAGELVIPDKLTHFEAAELLHLPIGTNGIPASLRHRATQVMADIVDSLIAPEQVGRSFHVTASRRKRTPTATPGHELGRTERNMAATTLEDRFSDDLIGRLPRLDRISRSHPEFDDEAGERLKNIAEDLAGEPTEEHLQSALDVLLRIQLEFRLAIEGSDQSPLRQGRLFEALVYRVARELLLGNRRSAGRLLRMLDEQAREVHRCGLVGERWGDIKNEMLAQEGTQTHDLTSDDVKWVTRMDARERALGFNPITTELRLLIFCCMIWIMEALSQLGGPELVLNEEYRRAFASNPDALHFKSRALLIDPVLPNYRILLGRQFVVSALLGHAENAGVWHTMSLYELRAAATSIWAKREEGLEAALVAVTAALRLDPEFPTFYHTRATIEKLLNRDGAARISLEAAIELSRFLLGAEAASDQTTQWVRLLEAWR
jgi:hypothetical protein